MCASNKRPFAGQLAFSIHSAPGRAAKGELGVVLGGLETGVKAGRNAPGSAN